MNLKTKSIIDFFLSQKPILEWFGEFLVLPENRNALGIVEKYFLETTRHVCLVYGSPGSGKTHLATYAIRHSRLKSVQISFDAFLNHCILNEISPQEIDYEKISKKFESVFFDNIDLSLASGTWADWLLMLEILATNGCKVICTASDVNKDFFRNSIVAQINNASMGRFALAQHLFFNKYARYPSNPFEASLCYKAARAATFRDVQTKCGSYYRLPHSFFPK